MGDGTPTHLSDADGVIEKPSRTIIFEALDARPEDSGVSVKQPRNASEDAISKAPLRISGSRFRKILLSLLTLLPLLRLPVSNFELSSNFLSFPLLMRRRLTYFLQGTFF